MALTEGSDDWNAPLRVPGIPELHLAGFDGPMDLLLDLAERQRIDLGQISMLALVEQFIDASVRLQPHVSLERRAEWLVMATRLLLLRSRLLFPASPAAEIAASQEADREARRLDQLAATRTLTAWLGARPQLDQDVFARPSGKSPRVTSYMALMEACLIVLRGPDRHPGAEAAFYRPAPMQLFRVSEAVTRIRAFVLERPGEAVAFADCLPIVPSADPRRTLKARSAVASSLIAVLELSRGGEIVAAQTGHAAPIVLRSP